jgi:hypothetical protein
MDKTWRRGRMVPSKRIVCKAQSAAVSGRVSVANKKHNVEATKLLKWLLEANLTLKMVAKSNNAVQKLVSNPVKAF